MKKEADQKDKNFVLCATGAMLDVLYSSPDYEIVGLVYNVIMRADRTLNEHPQEVVEAMKYYLPVEGEKWTDSDFNRLKWLKQTELTEADKKQIYNLASILADCTLSDSDDTVRKDKVSAVLNNIKDALSLT